MDVFVIDSLITLGKQKCLWHQLLVLQKSCGDFTLACITKWACLSIYSSRLRVIAEIHLYGKESHCLEVIVRTFPLYLPLSVLQFALFHKVCIIDKTLGCVTCLSGRREIDRTDPNASHQL